MGLNWSYGVSETRNTWEVLSSKLERRLIIVDLSVFNNLRTKLQCRINVINIKKKKKSI